MRTGTLRLQNSVFNVGLSIRCWRCRVTYLFYFIEISCVDPYTLPDLALNFTQETQRKMAASVDLRAMHCVKFNATHASHATQLRQAGNRPLIT